MSKTVSTKSTQSAPQPAAPTGDMATPDVIAIRKTCDAEGTGLSHYVLMDKQATR